MSEKHHFCLEINGREVHFCGRLHRGVVVWPDRNIPFLDQETLRAVGLAKLYEKRLAAAEAGQLDAIWDDAVLMRYAFKPLVA